MQVQNNTGGNPILRNIGKAALGLGFAVSVIAAVGGFYALGTNMDLSSLHLASLSSMSKVIELGAAAGGSSLTTLIVGGSLYKIVREKNKELNEKERLNEILTDALNYTSEAYNEKAEKIEELTFELLLRNVQNK